MSQTFSYKTFEKFEWTLIAAGAGIVLLILGFGSFFFPPQSNISTTRWLEVLTSRPAPEQPVFFTPLSQAIFVIIGILALINSVFIYRAFSVNIEVDDDAITYHRGRKIIKVPWSEVTDVKKRVAASRYGAGEIVTLVTEKDSYKISFNSTIKRYPELLEAIKTHTNIEFA
ncbi:MAG: hypothetical protein ACW963_05620 [Candidatus Sifarchaeia archaeon]|jgi:hypothetical protein